MYRKLEEYTSVVGQPRKPLSVGFKPSAAAVKHRETAIRSFARFEKNLAQGYRDDRSIHLGADVSLHKRADNLRSRAIDAGFLIFQELGKLSPRYDELFPNGVLADDPGLVAACENLVLNDVEPQVVFNYAAEVWRLIEWAKTLGLALPDLSELRVAGHLRNCAGRGKSVPGRVRHALVWFQQVFGIDLGADQIEIQRMLRSAIGTTLNPSSPEAAKLIPPDIVERLEMGVFEARSGVLKIFCGLGCLLTYGIKRWSDAKRISPRKRPRNSSGEL